MKKIDEKNQINIFYKIHDIIPEKMVLYHEFLLLLLDKINTTYLGSDVLCKDEDMQNHFSWCFKQVVNQFKKERIYFKEAGECYNYLWLFLYGAYYLSDNENKLELIKEYLKVLFSYNIKKSDMDMSVMKEIYHIFNNSLIK